MAGAPNLTPNPAIILLNVRDTCHLMHDNIDLLINQLSICDPPFRARRPVIVASEAGIAVVRLQN